MHFFSLCNMSLNYRAFQPGLSPSVMAYSQPALWSRLLFLIAGFRNNCPAPFKKRQLDNDLVQKGVFICYRAGYRSSSICLPGHCCECDYFHGLEGLAAHPGVPIPSPALPRAQLSPGLGCPGLGVQLVLEQQGWRVGAVTDTSQR